MTGSDLIMELTDEQGPSRESQVQPPLNVWQYFFQLDFENLPTLELTNRKVLGAQPEDRPVVAHAVNWTIEIAGAAPPRPAILRMRRTGPRRYDYWVYRPNDPEFAACSWMLDTFPNPRWTRGRRWLII